MSPVEYAAALPLAGLGPPQAQLQEIRMDTDLVLVLPFIA